MSGIMVADERKEGRWMMTHRMVLSSDPDTMVFPSGLMATLLTYSECPSRINFVSPDAASQTLMKCGGKCGGSHTRHPKP